VQGIFPWEKEIEKDFSGSFASSSYIRVSDRPGSAERQRGNPDHPIDQLERIGWAALQSSSRQAEKFASQVESPPHLEESSDHSTVSERQSQRRR